MVPNFLQISFAFRAKPVHVVILKLKFDKYGVKFFYHLFVFLYMRFIILNKNSTNMMSNFVNL